jgi:putative sugar O-methyltransferase
MPDSPRHYYFSKKIMNILDEKKIKRIIEIGGGYGGMAKILFSLNKNIDYYSVDLFEGCLLQYYYLSKCNIKTQIVFDAKNLKKNAVNLIPFSKKNLDIVKNIKNTDLLFNSRSFSELSETVVDCYFELINKKIKPRFVYHENSNYLLFPKSKRHIEILAKDFNIDKKYELINFNISPFGGGGGRYREYLYKRK